MLEERTANIRAAIERAMTILDPDQRPAAEQLLDERGVQTSSPPLEERAPPSP